MDSFTPERFGPYTLLRPIGRGGMAEVFLAQTLGIGGFERSLCVKRVLPEHADDTELIDLLVDEAKLVSRITHPNVAQVFDLGRVDERFYIAMEWIDGVDALKLLDACEKRDLHVPLPAAAYIVHEIARGLHAAHTLKDDEGRPIGIVHRDVTPTNVLLSLEGTVKLIDFGVARNLLRSRRTAVGVVKGKYNYLAPEQARGEPVDARVDVFAAGILLFELLAGEPLYPGSNAAQVVEKARNAKIPSLRKLRKDVPPELESIAQKALEKDRAARYQSAQAMADDLERFLSASAPGYGANQISELVRFLFPERAAEGAPDEPLDLSEYVANAASSIVSAPGVLRRAPDGDDEIEAAPTRVADLADIEQRRARRAAGFAVPPVTVLPTRGRKGRRRLVAAGVGAALLASGGLAAFVVSRRPTSVQIETTPPGATILVDGFDAQALTPATLPFERGPHQVVLRLAGYEESHVEVVDDTAISVALRPSRVDLEVASTPPGAIVFRDGAIVGSTPTTLAGLPPESDVTLELRAPGYEPLVYVHRTASGGRDRAAVQLVPVAPPPQGETSP